MEELFAGGLLGGGFLLLVGSVILGFLLFIAPLAIWLNLRKLNLQALQQTHHLREIRKLLMERGDSEK